MRPAPIVRWVAVAVALALALVVACASASASASASSSAWTTSDVELVRALLFNRASRSGSASDDGVLAFEYEHVHAVSGARTSLSYRARLSPQLRELSTVATRVQCGERTEGEQDGGVELTVQLRAPYPSETPAWARVGALFTSGSDVALRCDSGAVVHHRVQHVLAYDAASGVLRVRATRAASREAFEESRVRFHADDVQHLVDLLGATMADSGVHALLASDSPAADVAARLVSGSYSYQHTYQLAAWNWNEQTSSAAVQSYPLFSDSGSYDGATGSVTATCQNCYFYVNLAVDVEFSYSVNVFSASTASASASAQLTGKVNADMLINAQGAYSNSWSVNLVPMQAVLSDVFLFSIGPVPITLTVDFSLDAKAAVQTEATAVLEAGFDAAAAFGGGFACSLADGCSSVPGTDSSSFTVHPPQLTVTGRAATTVQLVPTVQLVVDGLLTGGIVPTVNLYNTFVYDSASSSCDLTYTHSLTITPTAYASIGIDLSVFKWQSPTEQFTLPTFGPYLSGSMCLYGASAAALGGASGAASLAVAERDWRATLAPYDPHAARVLRTPTPDVSATLRALFADRAIAQRVAHVDRASAAAVRSNVGGAASRASSSSSSSSSPVAGATTPCVTPTSTLAVGQSVVVDTCTSNALLAGVPLYCADSSAAPVAAYALTLAAGNYEIVGVVQNAETTGNVVINLRRGSASCSTFLDCSQQVSGGSQTFMTVVAPQSGSSFTLLVGTDTTTGTCGSVTITLQASTVQTFYVDSQYGSDSSFGTYAEPFATLEQALAASAANWQPSSDTEARIFVWPNLYADDFASQYLWPPSTGYTIPSELASSRVTISSMNRVPAPRLLLAWQQYSNDLMSSSAFKAIVFGTSFDTQIGCATSLLGTSPSGSGSAGDDCRAFNLQNVNGLALHGLWFEAFVSSSSGAQGGAAVLVQNSAVNITNSYFYNSKTSQVGADVLVTGTSTAWLAGNVFDSSAAGVGGAVAVTGTAALKLQASTFTRCASSKGVGAALLVGDGVNGASALASANVFTLGTARRGAAVYVLQNAAAMLVANTFQQNAATEYGGAVFVDAGALVVSQYNAMTQNSAGLTGGAIAVNGTNAVFSDQSSVVRQNSAASLFVGGGAFLQLNESFVSDGGFVSSMRGAPTNLASNRAGNVECRAAFVDLSTASITNAVAPFGTQMRNVNMTDCFVQQSASAARAAGRTASSAANGCGVCGTCQQCDAVRGVCTTAFADQHCQTFMGSSASCSPFSGTCWVQSMALAQYCPSPVNPTPTPAPVASLSAGAAAGIGVGATAAAAIIASVIAVVAVRAARRRGAVGRRGAAVARSAVAVNAEPLLASAAIDLTAPAAAGTTSSSSA